MSMRAMALGIKAHNEGQAYLFFMVMDNLTTDHSKELSVLIHSVVKNCFVYIVLYFKGLNTPFGCGSLLKVHALHLYY